MQFVFSVLTGEILLKKSANSGAIVFARSLWCAAWLYLSAILVHSAIDPRAIWGTFDVQTARALMHQNFEWFGALMGAAYAVFYTRFGAHWRYLADLYNSINLERLRLLTSEVPSGSSDDVARQFERIYEAFVHDAVDLHMATKPTFSSAVALMLTTPSVWERTGSTTESQRRRNDLADRLSDSLEGDDFSILKQRAETEARIFRVLLERASERTPPPGASPLVTDPTAASGVPAPSK